MSRPQVLDAAQLRARLAHALRLDVAHEGTLYLNALGCCYLACDERSVDESDALELLFTTQAEIEGVDGDDVLAALCLVEVPS